MLAMSKVVEIELTEDLQEDFESFLEVCNSFGIKPRIRSFLYYVNLFGTYKHPKGENGSNGI
jgi:hypothetical protein